MVNPAKILNALGSIGGLGQLTRNAKSAAGLIFGQAKNVLASPWSKFNADTDYNQWIKIAKIGTGVAGGTWSAAQFLRTHHDARSVLHHTNNLDGSYVWSRAQSVLFAASAALPVAGMLLPGGIRNLIKAAPLVAAIPTATGWTMDMIQSAALADFRHPLARFFQLGYDSYFINNYNSKNPALAGKSKGLPLWYKYVKPLDSKFLGMFGIDYKGKEFSFSKDAQENFTVSEKKEIQKV
jgi:hypothetical protein